MQFSAKQKTHLVLQTMYIVRIFLVYLVNICSCHPHYFIVKYYMKVSHILSVIYHVLPKCRQRTRESQSYIKQHERDKGEGKWRISNTCFYPVFFFIYLLSRKTSTIFVCTIQDKNQICVGWGKVGQTNIPIFEANKLTYKWASKQPRSG